MSYQYAVFDVETPNLKNDRICSVGITLIDGTEIRGSENIFINPECYFDDFNISIHGITEEDVEDCPSFPEVWEKLEPVFGGRILVAHNARFDLGVLKKTLSDYGIIPARPLVKYVDTVLVARHAFPHFPNHKLNTLCTLLGIPLDHHNSGSDAEAAAILLSGLLKEGLNVREFIRSYRLLEM